MPRLIYLADPMCPWCYAFGPQLDTLLGGLQETGVDLVQGGLRANRTIPLDPDQAAALQEQMQSAAAASGLPFSGNGLVRSGFVFNSEPACRAVAATAILWPQAAFDVFRAIQSAFFAEGQDVTQGDLLARIACSAIQTRGGAVQPDAFRNCWASKDAIAATLADFTLARHWNVIGFPTLVLERGSRHDIVTSGYATTLALVDRLQAIVDADAASAAAPPGQA